MEEALENEGLNANFAFGEPEMNELLEVEDAEIRIAEAEEVGDADLE